jgi:hypothetical protein
MNARFEIDPTYEPGHAITFYASEEYTVIASLDTIVRSRTVYAEFAIEEPWAFTITTNDGQHTVLTGRYNHPEQLTPELEEPLLRRQDCYFSAFGIEHELTWENEPVAVIVIRDGDDNSELDSILDVALIGPSAEELQRMLGGAIQDYEHRLGFSNLGKN